MMNKKRKGPPEHLTTNPELEAEGKRAREQFRAAVDATPQEVMDEIQQEMEINALKKEELQEEQFWNGYSNKFKEQVKTEDIFQEVQKFKILKAKENNNFFKKLLKTLGF
jgi:hypothetical protein